MDRKLWRVIHVRKHFEQITAQHLEKRGFETFAPLCRSHQSSPNGKECMDVPLFPEYVFCKCDAAEFQLIYPVPGILGVIQLVVEGLIPTQKIEKVRRVEKAHIANRALSEMASGERKFQEWEQDHFHRCEVCQAVSYVLLMAAAEERQAPGNDAA